MAGDAAVEALSAVLLCCKERQLTCGFDPKPGPCWKEPNSLPNPELLPGFLYWKLFLMETPVSCCKSSSSSKSQGLLLLPWQLHCLPLLGFVYF